MQFCIILETWNAVDVCLLMVVRWEEIGILQLDLLCLNLTLFFAFFFKYMACRLLKFTCETVRPCIFNYSFTNCILASVTKLECTKQVAFSKRLIKYYANLCVCIVCLSAHSGSVCSMMGKSLGNWKVSNTVTVYGCEMWNVLFGSTWSLSPENMWMKPHRQSCLSVFTSNSG